jgi:hypothetical protein
MFWTGFFAGFASCVALVICDHLYADFRAERRARASFLVTLTPEQKQRFFGFEGMGNWRQFRDLVEIEKDRQLQEASQVVER